MPQRTNFRNRPPQEVRVVVFGATGYIGRFVVKELVERGYQVIAFARKNSGVGGKQSREQVIADFPGATVRFGDVTDPASIAKEVFTEPADGILNVMSLQNLRIVARFRVGGVPDSIVAVGAPEHFH